MNVTCDSPLQAAKEELPIPALWQLLNLPGKPARSCRSPFREDRNPSFSIYDGGHRWKDHGTGLGGMPTSALRPAISPKQRVPVNSSSWPGQDTRQLPT